MWTRWEMRRLFGLRGLASWVQSGQARCSPILAEVSGAAIPPHQFIQRLNQRVSLSAME